MKKIIKINFIIILILVMFCYFSNSFAEEMIVEEIDRSSQKENINKSKENVNNKENKNTSKNNNEEDGRANIDNRENNDNINSNTNEDDEENGNNYEESYNESEDTEDSEFTEEAGENEETELDVLQKQKEELSNVMSNSYLQMGAIQNQLSDVLYEIESLNLDIIEKKNEIEKLENEEKVLIREIGEVEEELDRETEKYYNQKKLLGDRLVAMYEMGKTTYLDILLSSKSLSDFLSNYYMISEITKVDQNLIKTSEETKKNVETMSRKLQTKKTILEQSREKQEQLKIVLENMVIIQSNKFYDISAEELELHEQIIEYQKEINEIESEIRFLSLANVGSEYIGGVMSWPVPGYTRITSQFGMRTHPITGIYKLHTGVDIGAPTGTDFIAANDGVVVKAAYNTAYGNMVILDHGGGIQTLYAHGSQILVNEGDIIRQGTPVLKVGSTGYATGPHAHFEVRINGSCVEPLDYITSYGNNTNNFNNINNLNSSNHDSQNNNFDESSEKVFYEEYKKINNAVDNDEKDSNSEKSEKDDLEEN